MRKTLRLGLLAGSGLAALAFTSVAMAAYSPSLTVGESVNAVTGQSGTDVEYKQTDADDPLAHVMILSPAGYTVNLSQAPGTQIGTLDGSVIAGELGGVTVPVTGTIVVGDPSNPDLQATAMQCTGVATHAAIWLLNVAAGGQSLPAPVPLFVDPITSGNFAPFASSSVELCLPPPPLASFQIKLLDATLHTTGVYSGPSTPGTGRWTAVNTPYDADNHPNLLGTIETQALDATPVDQAFNAKRITKVRKVKHKRYTDYFYTYSVRLSGLLQAGGEAVGGANVDLMAGADKLDSTSTDDSGKYSETMKLTKTTKFHAEATTTPNPLLGASCIPPLPLGPTTMPCGTIMDPYLTSVSEEKTVVKPKLTHKRVKNKPRKRPKGH